MTHVYRILRKPYSKAPLDGEGAYRFGGRWSSPGVRLAYAAEHQSLAMVEYFVHIDESDAPLDLVLVTIVVPDVVSRQAISLRELPANWRATPPPSELAEFGDSFAKAGRSAILIAPSVLAPEESNWLINPSHAHFSRIHVLKTEAFGYDQRFFSGARVSRPRSKGVGKYRSGEPDVATRAKGILAAAAKRRRS